jgi:hypothetical protein
MRISVMKGPPDRAPASRWILSGTLVANLPADVCAGKESMNGLIPRLKVEEPGCCSTAEEGRTRTSRRVWRDVRVRLCGVEGKGGGPGTGQRGPWGR